MDFCDGLNGHAPQRLTYERSVPRGWHCLERLRRKYVTGGGLREMTLHLQLSLCFELTVQDASCQLATPAVKLVDIPARFDGLAALRTVSPNKSSLTSCHSHVISSQQ